jgi:hypothetical protein
MMGSGTFAEALAGSRREIMARGMIATDVGNNVSPGILLCLVEPFGIAMPLPPEGSEKAYLDVLGSSAQSRAASQI